MTGARESDTWDCVAVALWSSPHFLMRGTSQHLMAACRSMGWVVEETASGRSWIISDPSPGPDCSDLVGRIGPAPLMFSMYASAFSEDDRRGHP